MNLSPIVLFVYNRPWHTQQTIKALQKNDLASKSDLYIFSDGKKTNNDIEVSNVRSYIKTITGFKSIKIFERNENWGLAKNIVDGVSSILAKDKTVIVLEDDIVTSEGFLKYMNDALSIYENDDDVMHISGYMFPVKKSLPQTFFYNATSCWGWATWRCSWKHYNNDAKYLSNKISSKKMISKFNIDNSYPFFDQLEDNANGKLNTWAIKWNASVFLARGFSLHPYPSLVSNIGHDGLGENCGNSTKFNWENITKNITVNRIKIEENRSARKAMKKFNNSIYLKNNFLRRVLYKIIAAIPKKIKNMLNKILS